MEPAPPSLVARPSLYIVDAMNYLYRAFYGLPSLTTTKGVPSGAVYGLSTMLLRLEREHRPTHLCAVWDAPGRTFRDDIYAEYKSTREPMPPELVAQVEPVRRVIEAFGISTLMVAGVEADDVIATLARKGVAAGLDVVICSGDKDLMQLCGDGIVCLDTMKDRRLGPAEVREKFGVGPERVADVLALTGDKVDNVPGVPGIGPKTAAELINKFGDLDNLLAHAEEVKGKRGEALVAAREAVRLSRQLVALKEDVDLGKSLEELHRKEYDPERVGALFRELEFFRLVDQLTRGTGSGAASSAGAGSTASSRRPKRDETPPPKDNLDLDFDTEPPPPVDASRSASDAASEVAAADKATAPASLPVPTPAAPPPAAELLLDAASLVAFAAAAEAAGAFGMTALAEGTDLIRAGLVGLGFALPGGRRAYLPLAHRTLGGPVTMREAEALPLLAPLLASRSVRKHVHDGKQLDVLFARRGVALGDVATDSLIAGYLIDASRTRHDLEVLTVAEGLPPISPRASWMGSGRTARPADEIAADQAAAYVAAESAAALALSAPQSARLQAMGLAGLYTDVELPLARVLARIECQGVRLDTAFLRTLGEETNAGLAKLETEIHELAGGPFNINSPKQLAEILFGKLGLPIIRRTKTGPSTDAEVLEQLAAMHPVPAKIVEYRVLSKLKGTYIDALPQLVNPKTGRLHTTFNQAVAATGRLSSSDPNLQNIPIRTDVGRRIREAFIADPGAVIVSADYSQIELRILAHFSQDPAFLDAFRSGQDIHQRTAAEVFGLDLAAVTSEQRRIAKAINFGLVFGQTDFGLAQVLHIPRAQAKAYIESYFRRYAGVKTYMERSIVEARERGESTTLLGRRRPLPEIRASRAQDRAYAERIARNTPIQGSAADILKLAMIRVDAGMSAFPKAKLLLTVHDELLFEVPELEVEAFTAWAKKAMETVYELRVPLVVDVGHGPTWGQAH